MVLPGSSIYSTYIKFYRMRLRNIFSIVVLAGFIVMGLFSCKKGAQNKNEIGYDSIVIAKHVPLLEVNDTTLPYSDVNIRFKYPVKFRNAEDLTRLQQIFIGTFFNDEQYDSLLPQSAIDKFVAAYSEEYKDLAGNFEEDKKRLPKGEIPAWYWYYMSNTNKIMFQSDSLLSYAVEYSDYTGGAHGSYAITYTNIDLNNLVTITEEDLFIPNYKKPLTEIILQQLMKTNNVSSPDSLLEIGFFDINDIEPNNNFWLDNNGLHYSFNQYEIAPYAMGVIDVAVPYNELTAILKPQSPINHYLNK